MSMQDGCEHGYIAGCPECTGLNAALAHAEKAEARIQALEARLEAAEKVCEAAEALLKPDPPINSGVVVEAIMRGDTDTAARRIAPSFIRYEKVEVECNKALAAWRAIAGKGGEQVSEPNDCAEDWQKRAEKAEAERDALKAQLADITIELQAYASLTDGQGTKINAWRPVIEAACAFVAKCPQTCKSIGRDIGRAVHALPPKARP